MPRTSDLLTKAGGPAPLTALEREAVARYAQRLAELLGGRLARAILFGSRARGEGHEESDLDVAVVVSGAEAHVFRQVSDLAAELNLEYDFRVRLSPLALSEETLEQLRRRERAIARAILEEGIPL